MYNTLFVHIVDSFQNLPDKIRGIFLRIAPLFHYPVEKFASSDSVDKKKKREKKMNNN